MESPEGSKKDGALMIVSHRWNANLVVFYLGKPRCITPIILHLIYACALSLKS
jgi:hypothetical protein